MAPLIHSHPMMVHFPIALLTLASLAGLAYLYWRPDPALVILTWWPMCLGWVGGVVAVATGLLAQSGLPPAAPYRSVLNWHIGTGLALLVVYGILIYQRWLFGSTKNKRRRHGQHFSDLLDDPTRRIGFTLLATLGMLLVIASGWNGGRLVYEWGGECYAMIDDGQWTIDDDPSSIVYKRKRSVTKATSSAFTVCPIPG